MASNCSSIIRFFCFSFLAVLLNAFYTNSSFAASVNRTCNLTGLGALPSTAPNQANYLVCLMLGIDPTADPADVAMIQKLLTEKKHIETPLQKLDGPLYMQEVMGLLYNPGTFSTSTRQVFNLDALDPTSYVQTIAQIMLGANPVIPDKIQALIANVDKTIPRQYIVTHLMDNAAFDISNPILAFDLHGHKNVQPDNLINGGTGPVTVDSTSVEEDKKSIKANFIISPNFVGNSVKFFIAVLDNNQQFVGSIPELKYETANTTVPVEIEEHDLDDIVPPGTYTLQLGAFAEGDLGPRILYSLPKPVTVETRYDEGPYTIQYDVAYGTHKKQIMDILIPTTNAQSLRPAIINIHGGGFTGGTKYDERKSAERFANAGYVVANIDYRLTRYDEPGTLWPAQLKDGRAALNFIKQNAVALGIDPNKICAQGASAGARLAIWLGVDHSVACILDNSGASDFTYAPMMNGTPSPWYDGTMQGYDDMKGKSVGYPEQFGGATLEVLNMPFFQNESSINLVTSNSAPSFIASGYYDDSVSWAEGNEYHQALQKNNVNHIFYSYCGGHVFGGCTHTGQQPPTCVPAQGAKASCDEDYTMNQEIAWMNMMLGFGQ
jgi:acetyl esterase/lipase